MPKCDARWSSTTFFAIALTVAAFASRSIALADDRHPGQHWVAAWATAPAAFFQYIPPVAPAPPGPPTTFAPANIQPDLGFPFPDANTAGATDQTFRSIVKPDLRGKKMRFRFSNVFGTLPVTFSAVTVALQEYSGNLVDATLDAGDVWRQEVGDDPARPRNFQRRHQAVLGGRCRRSGCPRAQLGGQLRSRRQQRPDDLSQQRLCYFVRHRAWKLRPHERS